MNSKFTLESYFNRDMTNIIKGIAIIFMFALHMLAHPEWYETYTFSGIESFANIFIGPLDLCVPIFAFLTGYFYSFSKNKTYLYSLRKITNIYVSYLIVFILLFIPSVIFGDYQFTPIKFLLELFAIDYVVMFFCWYVMFYILAMLLLPIYARIADKHFLLAILTGVILPLLLFKAFHRGFVLDIYCLKTLCEDLAWLPCIFVGYIFARYQVFQRIYDPIFKHRITPPIFPFGN